MLLSGCLDEKQNRITKYEPGVYLGKKDSALSALRRIELRRRVREQSGFIQPAGVSNRASKTATGSLRNPKDSIAFYSRLNSRATNQRGP
jgi:hypothetical protein